MESNWNKYKLGDACEIIKEGFMPAANAAFPYIGLEHIEQQSLRLNGWGKSSEVTSNKFKFRKGDVLFGKLRPYFRKVVRAPFDGVCSTDIWVIRSKSNFSQDYLMYLLASDEFITIASNAASGTRMPRADWNMLKASEWLFPDLETQIRIAEILSALDHKIELAHRSNQTLEAIAQTLFRKYFVDDIDLEQLPEGWRWGTLSEIIDFTNGYAFSSKELLDEGGYDRLKVFKMGHINKGGGLNSDGTKSYFERRKAVGLEKYILKRGDLLMCMTDMKDSMALLGHTALMNVDDDYIVNQRVGLIRANNTLGISYPFLYTLTNSSAFIENLRSRANSGVQVNLSTTEIKASRVLIPAKDVNVAFNELTSPLFEHLFSNTTELRKLSEMRDMLLSRLLSGELNVTTTELVAESL
ncbi:MAG: restriction endonuclease subunit S [Bacteroidetes bacterium]|nr:restriction endonuclease subunit S [Bacteroidota bacterium]